MSSIKKQLKNIQAAALTKQEKDKIWQQVYLGMAQKQKIPVYYGLQLHTSLIKKLVAATLIFGMTTGTAFAADSARPGDILFPLDRAMEKTHLSFVSQEKKDILKVEFASERIGETKAIVEEIKTKIKQAEEVTPPTKIPTHKEIIDEKDIKENAINTNTTEITGEKTNVETLSSNATTTQDYAIEQQDTATTSQQEKENIVNEEIPPEQIAIEINDILGKNNSTTTVNFIEPQFVELPQFVEFVGPVEVEQEYGEISDNDKKRIELALGTTLDFLGDIKGELTEQGNTEAVSSVNNLLEELNSEIENLPKNIMFEVKLSPTKKKVQFEIASKDNKNGVQIEVPENNISEPKTEESEKEDSTSTPPPIPTNTQFEIQDDILKIIISKEILPQDEIEAPKEINAPTPPLPLLNPNNKETVSQIEPEIESEQIPENSDTLIITTGSTTVEKVEDIKKLKTNATTTINNTKATSTKETFLKNKQN